MPLHVLAFLTGSRHYEPLPAVLPACLLAAMRSSRRPDLTMYERVRAEWVVFTIAWKIGAETSIG
jgi:hypothetical protein